VLASTLASEALEQVELLRDEMTILGCSGEQARMVSWIVPQVPECQSRLGREIQDPIWNLGSNSAYAIFDRQSTTRDPDSFGLAPSCVTVGWHGYRCQRRSVYDGHYVIGEVPDRSLTRAGGPARVGAQQPDPARASGRGCRLS
jgi:hypothetical protein